MTDNKHAFFLLQVQTWFLHSSSLLLTPYQEFQQCGWFYNLQT